MFHVKQFRVDKENNFEVKKADELLHFLTLQLPDTSRTRIKEMLAHEVYVDNHKVTQYNYPLQPGMTVRIRRKGFKERFLPRELDLLFEDEYLLVINKHEGLLSNSKNPSDRTVISLLNRYLSATHQKAHAHIVHRLDRDTSGLMIVSKSKEVSQQFEADWKGMVYDRAYVAVAWGDISPDKDTIQSWFTDGEYCVLSSPVDNGGKLAVTHYEVKRRSRRYSLLELHLDTGRRNQIRVHLRDIKHPIVHDPMYGYKDDISPINRLALHAFKLCFIHPVTKRRMKFETPYPSQFVHLMEL